MRRWTVGVLALGLLAGCGKDQPEEVVSVPDSPYHPLAVGWQWTYVAGTRGLTAKRTVVKHEKVGGLPCALIETRRGQQVDREHLHPTADGLAIVALAGRKLTPPLRLLKLPPKAGDFWETTIREGKSRRKGTYLLGEDEVKVPKGTYRTITLHGEVEDGGHKTSFTYWFAEGVGFVKLRITEGGATAVYELKDFKRPEP